LKDYFNYNLKINLFPHQLKAVYEMEKREKNNEIHHKNYSIYSNIGIYADIAGYGKTLSMITLILRDQMKFDTDEPYIYENITQIYGNGSIIKKQMSQYQRLNVTLILVNQTIIKQWIDEFSYTSLNIVVINNKKKCELIDPQMYDVVLCTPTMFNYFVSRFPNYIWKRFVFDEPTHTKISGMRKIVAVFHWLITATPDMLLYTHNRNSYHYLGSLFSGFIDYNLFKHLVLKNDDEYVKTSFLLPPTHYIYYECYDIITSLLKNLIPEYITQMISAGNIEGAIKAMGGTSSNDIFDLIQSEKQDMINEANIKIARYSRIQDQIKVNKWTEKKKEYEFQLQQLSIRLKDVLQIQECNIFLHHIQDPILLKCCYQF
jgi:hypothetical protein